MASRCVASVIVTQKGVGEGFIRGFFRGKGEDCPLVNMEKEGLEKESLRGIIEELTHPGEEILHLLLPEDKHGLLREGLSLLRGEGFIAKEKGFRTYSSAKAKFLVCVFDAKRGKSLKALLSRPPEGVRLSFDEELEELSRGRREEVELYAPLHSYELRGRGVAEGAVWEVLGFSKELARSGAEVAGITLGKRA